MMNEWHNLHIISILFFHRTFISYFFLWKENFVRCEWLSLGMICFSFQWPILLCWVVEDLMKWRWKEKSLDTNNLSHFSSFYQNSTRKKLQVLKHLSGDGVVASDFAAFDIRWLIEKHTQMVYDNEFGAGLSCQLSCTTFLSAVRSAFTRW